MNECTTCKHCNWILITNIYTGEIRYCKKNKMKDQGDPKICKYYQKREL